MLHNGRQFFDLTSHKNQKRGTGQSQSHNRRLNVDDSFCFLFSLALLKFAGANANFQKCKTEQNKKKKQKKKNKQTKTKTLLPLAGVFLVRGVIGANGGGISVGPFLLGVEGTLEGRVPARGFLIGGSIFSSCLLSMTFLAW